MPVEANEIEWRYSAPGASQGDDESGTAEGSLGGYMSTTAVVGATMANVFAGIPLDDALPGGDVYRCLFLTHVNETATWKSVRLWIAAQTPGGADVAIGLDPTGVVDADDSDPQAVTIADETEAPEGVTFSNPTSEGSALEVGDLAPGTCIGVWFRLRWPPNPSAKALDTALLRYRGPSEL